MYNPFGALLIFRARMIYYSHLIENESLFIKFEH